MREYQPNDEVAIGLSWESPEGTREVVGERDMPDGRHLFVVMGRQSGNQLLSESDVRFEMRRDTANLTSRARTRGETEAREATERERTYLDGFEDTFTPRQRAKVVEAITRQVGVNNVFASRRDHIRRLVREGYRVAVVPGGARVLRNPATESYYTEKDLTKAALDYAEYLSARGYSPNEDQTWRDVYSREYKQAEGRGLQSWQAREEAAQAAWRDYETRTGQPAHLRNGSEDDVVARRLRRELEDLSEAQAAPSRSWSVPHLQAAQARTRDFAFAWRKRVLSLAEYGFLAERVVPIQIGLARRKAVYHIFSVDGADRYAVAPGTTPSASYREVTDEDLDGKSFEDWARVHLSLSPGFTLEESASTPTCPECLYEHRTGNVAPVDHSCESDGEPYRRIGHKPNAGHASAQRDAWNEDVRRALTSAGHGNRPFSVRELTERLQGRISSNDVRYQVSRLARAGYITFDESGTIGITNLGWNWIEGAPHQASNASGYYVWVLARGSNAPLAEGPWGPYDTLESAKTFARIGATEGAHDRAVSTGLDPKAPSFQIVRRYEAGTGERLL